MKLYFGNDAAAPIAKAQKTREVGPKAEAAGVVSFLSYAAGIHLLRGKNTGEIQGNQEEKP